MGGTDDSPVMCSVNALRECCVACPCWPLLAGFTAQFVGSAVSGKPIHTQCEMVPTLIGAGCWSLLGDRHFAVLS